MDENNLIMDQNNLIMDENNTQAHRNDKDRSNTEVILPTPSKYRSKGLFKSLSCSNVLLSKRFAEAASQEFPSKKAKNDLESTASLFFPSAPDLVSPRRTTSFFAKLNLHDEATAAFSSAIQVEPNLGHGWAEFGQYNDRMFDEQPTEIKLERV